MAAPAPAPAPDPDVDRAPDAAEDPGSEPALDVPGEDDPTLDVPADGDPALDLPTDEDLRALELAEVEAVPGTPLSAEELGVLDRMLTTEERLFAILANGGDPSATGTALDALARDVEGQLAADAPLRRSTEARLESDLRAALSLPDAMLDRMTSVAEKWIEQLPDLERLLVDDHVCDLLLRLTAFIW